MWKNSTWIFESTWFSSQPQSGRGSSNASATGCDLGVVYIWSPGRHSCTSFCFVQFLKQGVKEGCPGVEPGPVFFQRSFARLWAELRYSVNSPLLFNSLMWIFQVTWQLKLNYARCFTAFLITFPTPVSQTLSVGQNKTLNLSFPEVAHERGYKPNSHPLGACCNWQAVIHTWCCQISCRSGAWLHPSDQGGTLHPASSMHLVQPLSDSCAADRGIQAQPDAWCWLLPSQDLAGA